MLDTTQLTRINKQFSTFIFYRPDPEAIAIDAFTIKWSNDIFHLSTIHFNIRSFEKNHGRPSRRSTGRAQVAHPSMVSQSDANDQATAVRTETSEVTATTSQRPQEGTSASQEIKPAGMPLIRSYLDTRNILSTAKDVILASWRSTTSKQYHTYLSRWQRFCTEYVINPLTANVDNGIEFLKSLRQEGLGYSAINTARSALSLVINLLNSTFGTDALVASFLKGIFEQKPSPPRYSQIWDVEVQTTTRSVSEVSVLAHRTEMRNDH